MAPDRCKWYLIKGASFSVMKYSNRSKTQYKKERIENSYGGSVGVWFRALVL